MLDSIISLADLDRPQLWELMELAEQLKQMRARGREVEKRLSGKSVGMLFEKPSTRTRISFEVAVWELGGHPLFLSSKELQLGRGEPLKDTARVLSRYVHCVVARVISHDTLIELDRWSSIPVINALSDVEHPCQALADLLTIREAKGELEGVRAGWIGDGNNVCHSFMLGCALSGISLTVATPAGYEPNRDIVERARALGGDIALTHDPEQAAQGADVLYTDVWVSMGQDAERERRLMDFKGFQLSDELLALASSECIVLHCLPAHRGEEITDAVIEGERSMVFEQAENRLHAQKALLYKLFER
ncbi:ornithine carbamoyltransferase [Methermicoccus shengliensis]|uniref:ornithine carbamoyltransferase n=1 Tax=Methermicoccus shengliensis TaxID=660064 RepID=UPI0005B26D9B|nr:ornithine carbamoyltransferase [Methermicoccus shengliensis]KUK04449.1 MAG: Ornithine carbamoyltransferase, catabolic [Euryarchaeota archaeon 55_53]KUK29507.1 MAG: Ornithine carbamoyltransferase, catabolic [Methanosarcinales archeaon 56_1174]MDI3488072.1 ornithine carbamoyltransferase [Methanosarcinales archaeon]MDN5295729.1 ornithine carbamoyltransferase [Methanosarcinales archaeon]